MNIFTDSNKLKNINKPARYVGGEVNEIIKKEEKIKTNVALCYPNVYEKGMSSYYFKLLYDNLNIPQDVYCTRCFACDTDFEALLIEENCEIYSLENKKSIKNSDFIIFVIEDELDFTNFITMLKLANIEIYKSKRNENDPKVIVLSLNDINSKPIYKFADIVFENNNDIDNIKELIKYVLEYNSNMSISDEKINLMHIPYSIVPSIRINNMSIIINLEEVSEIEKIVDYIKDCMALQGVTKVSFINQDKIDSYKFCELVYKIKIGIDEIRISPRGLDFARFEEDVLKILLPCMEKSIIDFNITDYIKSNSDLFDIKDIKENILSKFMCIFKNNWSSIKIIYTIGVKEETYEEIDSTLELVQDIVTLYSKYRAKDKLNIILKINYYIPFTDDSNIYSLNSLNKLEMKVQYIKEKKLDSVIRLVTESTDAYISRCILKNGSEDVSNLLTYAYEFGARFDGDKYNNEAWNKALLQCNLLYKNASQKNRSVGEV